MEKTLTVGKTYTVTTASECSVTDSNGLVLCTAAAGEQKAFVATTPTIIFSDDSASVVAVFKGAPALGSRGGSGGGAGTPGTPAGFGTVTATATSLAAGSTPTASVETSGFNTAKNFAFSFGIPQGEKGEKGDKGDTGLTSEQISILTNYASAEGQNVSIGTDGTFTTQVGHTYVVTAESAVTVTQGDVTLNISAGSQQGFVATGTTATVSPTTCTVTEVFRAAATVTLGGTSGGGEEEPEEILPEGYSGVSFFENTREQSFSTDYTDENTTAWELDFQPININQQYIGVFSNYAVEDKTMTRLIPVDDYSWSFNVRTIGSKPNPLVVPCGLGMRSVVGINPNNFYGFAKRLALYHSPAASTNALPIVLFSGNGSTAKPTSNIYRVFRLTFWEGENKAFEVVPCLKNGVPCFYNKVTGADYFSEQEVQVTVGLTLAQARKIDSLLPDSGGTLTITIPWEIVDINNEVTDSAVQAAITRAEAKGWTLTIKAYNK